MAPTRMDNKFHYGLMVGTNEFSIFIEEMKNNSSFTSELGLETNNASQKVASVK